MASGAQLSITEQRSASRHSVDFPVIGEHRRLGDIHVHIVNISAHGFMMSGTLPLERGERITIRLPIVGRIEAHIIWVTEGRAGFQFERLIRLDEFPKLINAIQPNARLRARR